MKARVSLALMAALLVVLGGYALISRLQRPKLWFTYSMTPLSERSYEKLAERPSWAKSVLTMADGVRLAGLVSRPASRNAPWLLFFPGNDASQLANGQNLLEQVRGQHDWGLFLYATRGYDASGGTPSPAAYAADAQQVLASVMRQNGVQPEQMHLIAFSLGGYSACQAFSQAAQHGQKPRTLSLLASVARVAMLRTSVWASFGTGDVYDVLPLLSDVPGPVLVVHGTADEAFRAQRQDTLIMERLGDRGRHLEVPGAGHSALLESAAAISAVRAMVEAHSATGAAVPGVSEAPRLPTDVAKP